MQLLSQHFQILKDLNIVSVFIRILSAILCGGLIGYFRDKLNKEAGFRTHISVCIGCVVTILVGEYMTTLYSKVDPSRIGAQAISALGFLGAGTILMSKDNHVVGLTTAAGLWATAGIGLAFGAGFYELGFIATIAVLCTQNLLKNKLFKEPLQDEGGTGVASKDSE